MGPRVPPEMMAGSAEPTLSRIGLGCSRIGSFNNPQPLRESVRLVRDAMDIGVTTIDTANIYGQGDSERAIGKALAGARQNAFLVTKAGQNFSSRARALLWAKPILRPLLASRAQGQAVTARRGEVLGADWSPGAITRSLEASLRRLATDCVDGFLLHSPPAEVAGDPVIAEMLAGLRSAGKARHVGVSCDDAASLQAALVIPCLTILQLPLDVLRETDHAGEIAERGLIVLAREVIRMSPQVAPSQAVRAALDDPRIACTLVGTTKLAHLAEIAAQMPVSPPQPAMVMSD